MWLIKIHCLALWLGVFLFFIATFLGSVETKNVMNGNSTNKNKNNEKPSKTKTNSPSKKNKKGNKKSRSKGKSQSKKPAGKSQDDSGPEISVYSCPDDAVEMNCLSCKTKIYRHCPLAAATKITDVMVLKEFPDSYGKCNVGKRNENFGVYDQHILWVDKGCRARFLVCYEKGEHEPKTINCMYTSSKHRCPTGLHGLRLNVDIKVNLLWSFGTGKCKEGDTWGFDHDDIWVDRGCSATFKVLW